jgi:hypothetical protein
MSEDRFVYATFEEAKLTLNMRPL